MQNLKDLLTWLRTLIVTEPAEVLFGVNALAGLVAAWGLPLDRAEVGAVSVIAGALVSVITACLARPVKLPLIRGGLFTILMAFGAFHVHWSADRIGTTSLVLSLLLAVFLRQSLTPLMTAAHVAASKAGSKPKAAKRSTGKRSGAAGVIALALALLSAGLLTSHTAQPNGRAWNGRAALTAAHPRCFGKCFHAAPDDRAWNGRHTAL